MKKLLSVGILALLALACTVRADTYTYTVTATNGVAYTNAVGASGWLDKIEVSQDTMSTCTVVVATYDQDTAVDTYCTLSSTANRSTVVRPRLIGTSNAGVALAAVTADSSTVTNGVAATTQLIAQYERPLIGGNTKIVVTGGGGAASAENDVKVVIYYEPLKR